MALFHITQLGAECVKIDHRLEACVVVATLRLGGYEMSTLRHYFISDSLDDLEVLEEELEATDIGTPRIHVLSNDDTGLANHTHLNAVQSLLKNDVIHAALIGAVVGLVSIALLLGTIYALGLHETSAGWLPFIFLSFVIFGFCIWEGGFIGFQIPNYHFKRFESALGEGKHVFIVELSPEQESVFENLLKQHPGLQESGTELGKPHWIFALRSRLFKFIDRNLLSYTQVK